MIDSVPCVASKVVCSYQVCSGSIDKRQLPKRQDRNLVGGSFGRGVDEQCYPCLKAIIADTVGAIVEKSMSTTSLHQFRGVVPMGFLGAVDSQNSPISTSLFRSHRTHAYDSGPTKPRCGTSLASEKPAPYIVPSMRRYLSMRRVITYAGCYLLARTRFCV